VALAAAVLVRLIAIAVDFTPMLLIVGWGAVGRARRWRRIEPARQAHLP
jgi:hypothetical protein